MQDLINPLCHIKLRFPNSLFELAQQLLGVSPLAWDAALYVDVARCGFGCRMVTEVEAWTALKSIVPSVVRTYVSWGEYADHYLLGRKAAGPAARHPGHGLPRPAVRRRRASLRPAGPGEPSQPLEPGPLGHHQSPRPRTLTPAIRDNGPHESVPRRRHRAAHPEAG
ncbi:DUF1266 domain-containing protein [Streptomyces sp. NPDC001315]|uniref:DUF1266 domain-containing protein n=1 Tax=Streptomyces sp. NPDC001315 TaxID=3364562 RepID=UPI0036B41DF0